MDSADQDEWLELALAIRGQLLRYAANVPAMKPDELVDYIAATRDALWLERDAACFDREVTLRLERTTYESGQ